ncbi:MAG: ABC transporter ATP-binding protein [Oscillospiraceae bacterium]|nr:ABC transporter ATP-binding protein [Oscillospiraceae bacterium]
MSKAISVKDLHITYKSLKSVSSKRAIFSFGKNKLETFEAVRGVSFDVEEGQVVGLIGKNGSGKSTLLRSIAGIFSPDTGEIELYGKSVSLLSIGVGFKTNLSGRENIFLSGLLMGFKKSEIEAKLNDIIEFSELGAFIDKPVKTYSSGMYSKLAFSITAVMETDIMLVDEVLSVGDEKFKKKSYDKIKELISDKTRTVIIVSHNSETLKRLCDHIIWINNGTLMMQGEPQEVLAAYKDFMK